MEILVDGKNIFTCEKPELQEVSKIMKQAWNLADQKHVASFYPGMKVSFEHRGRTINALVTKTNKTTISVSSDIGSYNVSPGLLTLRE